MDKQAPDKENKTTLSWTRSVVENRVPDPLRIASSLSRSVFGRVRSVSRWMYFSSHEHQWPSPPSTRHMFCRCASLLFPFASYWVVLLCASCSVVQRAVVEKIPSVIASSGWFENSGRGGDEFWVTEAGGVRNTNSQVLFPHTVMPRVFVWFVSRRHASQKAGLSESTENFAFGLSGWEKFAQVLSSLNSDLLVLIERNSFRNNLIFAKSMILSFISFLWVLPVRSQVNYRSDIFDLERSLWEKATLIFLSGMMLSIWECSLEWKTKFSCVIEFLWSSYMHSTYFYSRRFIAKVCPRRVTVSNRKRSIFKCGVSSAKM